MPIYVVNRACCTDDDHGSYDLHEAECLAAGMTRFVMKPIGSESLTRLILECHTGHAAAPTEAQ